MINFDEFNLKCESYYFEDNLAISSEKISSDMIRKKKDEQKIHCNGSLPEINKKKWEQ